MSSSSDSLQVKYDKCTIFSDFERRDPTRPDPRMDPTRGQLCVGSTSLLGTSREHYDKLSLAAEDIISAPASQAYVERVFSQSVACSPLVAEIE